MFDGGRGQCSALAFATTVFLVTVAGDAVAQTAAEPAPQATELPELVVEAKAPSKKKQAVQPAPASESQPAVEAAPPLRTLEPEEAGSQLGLTRPYAGGQVATGGRFGLLGNIEYPDSPFSSASYTSELIKNQQSDSVGDVLLNDPTVRVAQGFGNFQEVYIIRGFPVYSDDITLNGLHGIVPRQFVAAPLVERVEVLRGVSAFVNGAAPGSSGVGGTVNLVPKRAPFEDLTSFTLGYESDGQVVSSIDMGRRYGFEKEWGVRVGVTGRKGDTAVDDEERELGAASLGLDYLGRAARFSVDLGYQDHKIDDPRPQVTPLGAAPNPPGSDQNYAQPWTYSNDRHLFMVARGEVDLNEHITAWAAGGFRFGDEGNVFANPRATPDGSLSAYRFDNVRQDDVYSGDAGVRATFDTGPVGHRVIVSGSATRLDSKNAYAFSNFAGVPVGTLRNPLAVAPPIPNALLGGTLASPLTTEETQTSSVAIADTLSFFNETVLLTVGARYQEISQKTFNYNTGALDTAVDGSEVTPVAGLVVKPFRSVSLFANYAEALQKGEIAPANSGGAPVLNAGEVLDPFVSEQYEFGAKYDGGNFGATLSFFSISKQQAIIENQMLVASGEQRNRGIELSFYGEPVTGLRLLGGFAVVDARLEDTANGVDEGNRAVGVPKFQANLGVEYDLPFVPGLTVDGRMIHTGKQYINTANTFEVDSWTRFDVGLRYATFWGDTPVTVRARVENVTDESYWASVGGFPGSNYLVQGAPRTFLTNVTVDF